MKSEKSKVAFEMLPYRNTLILKQSKKYVLHTTAQRCDLALKLEDVIKAKAKESYEQNVGRPEKSNPTSDTIKVNTNEELGKIAGVGHNTIFC